MQFKARQSLGAAASVVSAAAQGGSTPPALPPEISSYYLPVQKRASADQKLVLLAIPVHLDQNAFFQYHLRVDTQADLAFLTPITEEIIPVSWESAQKS